MTQPPHRSIMQILLDCETSSDSSDSLDMFGNLKSPFCLDVTHNSSTEVQVGSEAASDSGKSEASEILCDIPLD